MSDSLTPKELNAMADIARGEFNAATHDLQDALSRLRRATRCYLHCHALMSTNPNGTLVAFAAQNRSNWSGGPLNPKNQAEAAMREQALDLLDNEQWRRKPMPINHKEQQC